MPEDDPRRQELEALRTRIAALESRMDAATNATAQANAAKLQADTDKTVAETRELAVDSAKTRAETTKTEAETDRVRADSSKAAAEKLKIEVDLNPTAATNTRGVVELERIRAEAGKLSADSAKATAEKTRIEADLNPTATTNARGVVELERIRAEAGKLNRETKYPGGLLTAEWVKGVGTLVLAGGALWTASTAFSNYDLSRSNAQFDHATHRRAEAAELVRGLGGETQQPGARMAAAVGLRAFLSDPDPQLRTLAIDGLTYGLELERDRDVQQAMEDALVAAGAEAVEPLRRMAKLADTQVRATLNRSVKDECPDPGQETSDDERAAQRQSSMVDAVLALARIRGVAPDFSFLNLKCYHLYTATESLKGARFQQTILWQTDLYGLDLENADLTSATATAAKFNRTNLTGANFLDAVLTNALFSGATGLTAEQLRKARSLQCAKLDSPLSTELNASTQTATGGCKP